MVVLYRIRDWHKHRRFRVYGSMEMEDLFQVVYDERIQRGVHGDFHMTIIDESSMGLDGLR